MLTDLYKYTLLGDQIVKTVQPRNHENKAALKLDSLYVERNVQNTLFPMNDMYL